VYELLFYIVGLFVLPISQLNYYLKALKKLYLVNFDRKLGRNVDVLKENKMELKKNGNIKHKVI